MNILVCTSANSSFNSLRPELEIYVSLARSGHNITLITHNNDIYSKRFTEHGISVIEKPIVKKISVASIQLIRSTIKSKAIDIVYATNSRSIPNAAFACIGLNVKLIAYRGTASGLYWHDPGNYLGLLNPRIDGVICVSKYVYNFVSSKSAFKNKRVVAIYKGHDTAWYNSEPADLTEFGINKTDFTAICVTNARPHKGLDIVLKAVDQLSDMKNFHLLLVGRGIDKQPYKSLFENNQMKSRIHLAGYRNDAPELIAACDVLIQPSTGGEGLPRVILESLAYATPVIASDIPGSMEIINDGVNGKIVPAGDATALGKSLKQLCNDPEALQTLVSNSQSILENKMSHRQTVKEYIEYFESLFSPKIIS
ncbi:MAG TPA: glycosyltransferase family 1 protein [Gammaproteobacteria bacterium]|nr:glycosyltransferase family 1 protein [Gammaproteobacteria bacterium]